jgi:uncharacterized protein YjbI with pentapeptide repeats
LPQEKSRYKEISLEELRRVAHEHERWVLSKGTEGARANLEGMALNIIKWDNAQLTGANFKGSIFSPMSMRSVSLSEANLEGAALGMTDLTEAYLDDANLRGAYLQETKLHGAYLHNADLRGAYLKSANFEGQEKSPEDVAKEEEDLRNSGLLGEDEPLAKEFCWRGPADVTGANFRGADLSDAMLSDVKGLTASSLAGADLTNAKLPPGIAKFDFLQHVAEISKTAQSAYLAMIAACAYSWLTIATSAESAVKLPLVETPVPLAAFYLAAPTILLAVYVYLHMYLQRLWTGLGSLPARFPDGRPLDETAFPWLLTSLVRAHMPLLKSDRPPLWWLQVGISVLTAWFLVPITIGGFWVSRFRHGGWLGLVLLTAVMGAAVWLGIATLWGTRAALSAGGAWPAVDRTK